MKIRNPNLDSNSSKQERDNISLPPLETITVNSSKNPFLVWFGWTATVILISFAGDFIGRSRKTHITQNRRTVIGKTNLFKL